MKRKRATAAKMEAPPSGRKKAKANAKAESETQAEQRVKGKGQSDVINVEFDFVEPDEVHYHSVKQLLTEGRWGFAGLDPGEVADALVNQGNIGTVVKSDAGDEDSICGFFTALNLRQFDQLKWPGLATQALRARSKAHATPEAQKALESLLARQGKGAEVGLLFSERMVNLPPELVPPMVQAMQKDVEWSCTTPECPADERPFYFFTHYIGVARCQMVAGSSASSSAAVPRDGPPGLPRESVYLAFEEEELVRRALFAFAFPAPVNENAAPGPAEHRVVFGVTRQVFEKVGGLLKVPEEA